MRRSLKRGSRPMGGVKSLSLILAAAIFSVAAWAQTSAGSSSRLAPIFSAGTPASAPARTAPRQHVPAFVDNEALSYPALDAQLGARSDPGRSTETRLNELDAEARRGDMSFQEYLERQKSILRGN
jgi:hypothetical protein